MIFDPFFVPCRNVLCKLSFSSKKICPVVADDRIRFASSNNKSHYCIETTVCVQFRYHFYMHRFHSQTSKQTTPSLFVSAPNLHKEMALVQMLFRSRLMWTLNGANKPIGSITEETNDKIFLWVIGASTSSFVPLHTWRLSSITVHCSPSTEDPSVLGSTWTCFVLLIGFNLRGLLR